MQKLYTRAHLDLILNHYSSVMAELNKMDSYELTTSLSTILRDFSYSFRQTRIKFQPLSIELMDDELTEIKWTGIGSTIQKIPGESVRTM